MLEIKNDRDEMITTINKQDQDLLLSKVLIFALQGSDIQVSDCYCDNIQNSKIALHTFLSLLHKENIEYNGEQLYHAIKLMSGLCPDLDLHDIIFIKKIMEKYHSIDILKEYCSWMFNKYHSVLIDEYKYMNNNNLFDRIIKLARIDAVCYYYKDVFIQGEYGTINFTNIKTGNYGSYHAYEYENWSSVDDYNFYFQDGDLHIEILISRSKCKLRFKLLFIDSILPVVVPLTMDNENIEHIHFHNISMPFDDHELIVEDGDDNIYEDKVYNVQYKMSIFITNDIIVKFDISNNLVQVFKII
ncbi:Hypothetical protein ORPV_629 [Orpheovirus IHUMI-LCC2]|uniref:Uncharacterized protein n=1 Tax=Orpheovirus IHUMI-LCC2 TaxID=2023057 RepID=A0A2I2L4S3_9VIRU|nr:Hypothetical protein ORPV_629 [Orpheovirus IHUMI-LCC2]SNW62533.1 Hypothetical protein ORPV_629 [Orpheovirus IHUMI-LCC2]